MNESAFYSHLQSVKVVEKSNSY